MKSMIRVLWLMASFVIFFVGGTHLRFPPLTLVLVWFVLVLAVVWTWTAIAERRERAQWLRRMSDEDGSLFAPAARDQLVHALKAWQEARPTERKVFDEALALRLPEFLDAVGSAVFALSHDAASYYATLSDDFLGPILRAFQEDKPFCANVLAHLEGEPSAEVWRALLKASISALDGEAGAVKQVADYWRALPTSAAPRNDFETTHLLGLWANTSGDRSLIGSLDLQEH